MKIFQNKLIQKNLFGLSSKGKSVYQYTLSSESGLVCKILNYGGTIKELWIPDKNGKLIDVVLGFDTLEEYEKFNSSYFFGSIIGRYANRIANGRFQIDNKIYQLPLNDGDRPNTLHGGLNGFHSAVFDAAFEETNSKQAVLVLKYKSSDGEEGFPGNLDVTVTYTLADLQLVVEYFATTDKPTVVNMTQHSYFNLSAKDTILDHYLVINGDFYTPVDENLIPTGEIKPVEGTALDFRKPRKISDGISQILQEGFLGYDHNFVIKGKVGELRFAAALFEESTGICMEVYTTQPGLQLYTGNYLSNVRGKHGRIYNRYAGLCLETQNFPDAPNHENFPSALLLPGQVYHHKTIYKFRYFDKLPMNFE
nr:aldose epimerase family protein [Pseudothermotoga thermarum]